MAEEFKLKGLVENETTRRQFNKQTVSLQDYHANKFTQAAIAKAIFPQLNPLQETEFHSELFPKAFSNEVDTTLRDLYGRLVDDGVTRLVIDEKGVTKEKAELPESLQVAGPLQRGETVYSNLGEELARNLFLKQGMTDGNDFDAIYVKAMWDAALASAATYDYEDVFNFYLDDYKDKVGKFEAYWNKKHQKGMNKTGVTWSLKDKAGPINSVAHYVQTGKTPVTDDEFSKIYTMLENHGMRKNVLDLVVNIKDARLRRIEYELDSKPELYTFELSDKNPLPVDRDEVTRRYTKDTVNLVKEYGESVIMLKNSILKRPRFPKQAKESFDMLFPVSRAQGTVERIDSALNAFDAIARDEALPDTYEGVPEALSTVTDYVDGANITGDKMSIAAGKVIAAINKGSELENSFYNGFTIMHARQENIRDELMKTPGLVEELSPDKLDQAKFRISNLITMYGELLHATKAKWNSPEERMNYVIGLRNAHGALDARDALETPEGNFYKKLDQAVQFYEATSNDSSNYQDAVNTVDVVSDELSNGRPLLSLDELKDLRLKKIGADLDLLPQVTADRPIRTYEEVTMDDLNEQHNRMREFLGVAMQNQHLTNPIYVVSQLSKSIDFYNAVTTATKNGEVQYDARTRERELIDVKNYLIASNPSLFDN